MGQCGQAGELAESPVAQQDVTLLEGLPQLMEQPQIVVVHIAEHDVKHRAAAQGEEHHELKDGKAAALLLDGGLRIAFLVLWRIGQLGGGSIDDLDRAAIDLAA